MRMMFGRLAWVKLAAKVSRAETMRRNLESWSMRCCKLSNRLAKGLCASAVSCKPRAIFYRGFVILVEAISSVDAGEARSA